MPKLFREEEQGSQIEFSQNTIEPQNAQVVDSRKSEVRLLIIHQDCLFCI